MSGAGIARSNAVLQEQRDSFLREGAPSAERRKDRLQRAIRMLLAYQDRIVAAVSEDFGARSAMTTRAAEILPSVGALRYAIAALDEWMRPEKRTLVPGTTGPGAWAEVRCQPLGVVGVISPWNAPFLLSVRPLAGILAAGNRCMIKPSELTPASADLLALMVREFFDESELAVLTGGQDVGEAFSALPFDHLMFTGSTAVAKKVMKMAAENLVPLTLELGGKSPVIVSRTCDIGQAALRIVHGKLLNAGQVCISPDYVLVETSRAPEFIAACLDAAAALYPDIESDDEYTSMISTRHYRRALDLIADATRKGARVAGTGELPSMAVTGARRKIPLHVLTGVTDDMTVMTEEIFAPILPVMTYDDIREAVAYVNARPRPLATYYFGEDPDEMELVIDRTWSGTMAINDVVVQGSREELPYGGIGPSGMGCYKGRDGFRNFSHVKPVFHQTPVEDALRPMRPPYTEDVVARVGSLLSAAGNRAD